MLKFTIKKIEYRNYSFVDIEESLAYPFHIQTELVPEQDKQLQDSFLHQGVILSFTPVDGDTQRFTWIEKEKTYYGYVVQEHRHYDMEGRLGAVALEIYHPLHLLNSGCHFRIFHEKKLTEIWDAVLEVYKDAWSQYKITAPEYSADLSAITIPYCTQYEETDLHFFLRLCETYGARLILHDQKVRLEGYKTPIAGETFSVPSLTRAYWKENIGSQARNLKHRNIEYTQNFYEGKSLVETQTTAVPNTRGDSLTYPYWVDLFEPKVPTAQERMEVQKRCLQHTESDYVVSNQDSQNNEPLVGVRAGQKFLLYGMKEDQAIYAYHVKWHLGGALQAGGQGAIQKQIGYQLLFKARETKYPYIMPEEHVKTKIDGFLRATVVVPEKASAGDKDRLGRIKVQFLWQEKPGPTCWVRLAMPYAGSDHGYYVMPEIGDEVLIAFEGGDIDRPLCLGSVYNLDANVLKRFDEGKQITTSLWKTPNTIYLKFHDTPNPENEQTVIMAVQKTSVLYMDNRAKINICVQYKDGNSLVCLEKSKITIHTHGSQNSVITLDEGKIKISAQDSIVVEAKDVTVQGASKVDVKAGAVSIQAANIKLGAGMAAPVVVPNTPGYTGDGTVG